MSTEAGAAARRTVAALLLTWLFALPAHGQVSDQKAYEDACQAYSSGLYSIAFRDLMPFAARGDAWSQFAVAEMLRTGKGVERDREEALVWYRRAAVQGLGAAQCNLGSALYFGWGTAPDPQAAIDWWLEAALKGNSCAMFNLGTEIARGRYIVRDYVRAYRWLLEADKRGCTHAPEILRNLRKVMTPVQIRLAEKMSISEATRFKQHGLTVPAAPPD